LINNDIAVLSGCFFYAQKNIFEKKLKIISKNNQLNLVIQRQSSNFVSSKKQ